MTNMYMYPVKIRISHSQKRKILEELGFVDPEFKRRIRKLELVTK